MNKEIINDIRNLLIGSYKETDRVTLHSLLWSIDAKHHLIPSFDEINESLKKIEGIQIASFEDGINLIFKKGIKSEIINQKHIDNAMIEYEKVINEFKNRKST